MPIASGRSTSSPGATMQTANMTNYTYEGPDGRLRRVSLRQLSHKVVIADVKSYGEVPKVADDGAKN